MVVLANVPVTASNGQYANVSSAARALQRRHNGATLDDGDGGADDPAVVDIVFADVGAVARDGIHEADDQYAVQSASLTVAKTSTVDQRSVQRRSVNPKAIPGAVIEYTIDGREHSGTTDADAASRRTTSIPTNTAYRCGGSLHA